MFKWIYELKAKLQEKLSEKGQGMTEYAIILAVVAIVAVAVFYGGADGQKGLQKTVGDAYNTATNQINKINNAANNTSAVATSTTPTT